MKSNKYIVLVIFVLFAVSSLSALGAFNMFSGRNRPDLNWFEIETEYSRIIYSDNLYDMALETAAIADSTFITLTKSFGILPQNRKGDIDKVIIYISDQDNIPNGACVLSEYIFIWVSQNDYLKIFTGNHKWIRKVVSHEMVHWFLAYSLRDWLSKFIPLGMVSFPTNINEGFAQHFSGEDWGLNRGDRYLRTWAFATNNKANSRWQGGFMYGNGFAFVKYLSEFYGEEKLFELLKYRSKLGLYDFNTAFKKVYKKTLSEMQQEWTLYTKTWYYGEAYLQKVISDDINSKTNTLNAVVPLKTNFTINNLVMKTDNVLIDAKLSKNQNYSSLISGKLVIDSLKADKFIINNINYIEEAGGYNSLDISSQGDFVTYTRYTRHKHGRLAPRVYLYNIYSGKKHNLGEGNIPTVTNNGKVFYQKLNLEANNIYISNIIDKKVTTKTFISFLPENQIGEMKLNSDDSILAVSIFDSNRNFLVSLFDVYTAEVIDVIKFDNMPQQLVWQDIDKLSISVENSHNFVLDLYIYNSVDKTIKEYQGPPLNIFPVLITNSDTGLNTISLTELNRDNKVLGKVSFTDKTDKNEIISPNNYYSRWIHNKPQYQIPDEIVAYENLDFKKYNTLKNIKFRQGLVYPSSNGLFGTAVLSEALGKHLVMGMFYVPFSSSTDPLYFFSYQNNTLKPTLNFFTMQTKWYAGIVDNKFYYNKINQIGLEFQYPVNIYQRPFTSLSWGGGLVYNKFELSNDSKKYSHLFADDDLILSNININYNYNLPWRNDLFHPVKSLKTSISYDYSNESLGMKMDYWQLKVFNDMSVTPFREVFKSEFIKTIAVQNRITYRETGKDPLLQFMPGVDDSEFIQVNGKPLFSRLYLRGYEQTLWGKKLFSMQNDLKFKLLDDTPFSLYLGSPILSSGYLGFSLWVDYTKLFQPDINNDDTSSITYKAVGAEVRSVWDILGITTLHKYGHAWDTKHNKLGYYYMMEIPFSLF